MENLKKFRVQELNLTEKKQINGGWLIGLLIAAVIDIINDPEDFTAGFNATFVEQQL